MKILEVSDSFYPNVDGPNSVMVNIALKLKELGHEVELLVPKFPQIVNIEGLTIHRCPSISAGKGYRAALPALNGKIKKLIKKGDFDLIHLHSPFPLSKYAAKLGKKYGIPVIITVHTKFRDEFEKRLKLKFLQRFMMGYIMKCIKRCDGVVCVSDGMAETLREYGLKRDDVKVIYNATDMPPADISETEAVEDVRKMHSLNGKFVFSFAGRLAEVKNVQFSLKVLAEVKKRGFDNFKFLIIGDGEYGKTLEKTAAKLGLTENVEFAGRITERKLLAEYYAACDLFLFPSLFDSSGLVIQEAAANGLPSATVAGSCAAERIENGVNGFAWDYDAGVWTDEIIKLISNPSAAKLAGERAKSSVCLNWKDITKQYCEYYKTFL